MLADRSWPTAPIRPPIPSNRRRSARHGPGAGSGERQLLGNYDLVFFTSHFRILGIDAILDALRHV
jgi:hypothetical protein